MYWVSHRWVDVIWSLHSSLCILVDRRKNRLMISSAYLELPWGHHDQLHCPVMPIRPNSTPTKYRSSWFKVEDSRWRAAGHHPDKIGRVGGGTGLIGVTWGRRGRFSCTYIPSFSPAPLLYHTLSQPYRPEEVVPVAAMVFDFEYHRLARQVVSSGKWRLYFTRLRCAPCR